MFASPAVATPGGGRGIRGLIYVGDAYRRINVRFAYPRDPKDSHLLELAIAGRATHLISTDKDLLCFPTGRGEAAKRLRRRLANLAIVTPGDFHRLLSHLV